MSFPWIADIKDTGAFENFTKYDQKPRYSQMHCFKFLCKSVGVKYVLHMFPKPHLKMECMLPWHRHAARLSQLQQQPTVVTSACTCRECKVQPHTVTHRISLQNVPQTTGTYRIQAVQVMPGKHGTSTVHLNPSAFLKWVLATHLNTFRNCSS